MTHITIKREVVEQALDALEWSRPHHNAEITHDEAITTLRTALEAQEGAEPFTPAELVVMNEGYIHAKEHGLSQAAPAAQEPVAYLYIEATYPEGDLRGRQWKFHQFSRSKPDRPWMQRDVVPLYDHPAPAAREPLTDEHYNNLVMEHLGPHALTGGKMSVYDAFLLAIRATEAAHGIGTQEQK